MVRNQTKNRADLKRKAIALRKTGLSYKEIGTKIGLSKSTCSFWLKDVLLKPAHRKRLYTKMVTHFLAKGPRSQKERRAKEVAQIIKEAEKDIITPPSLETMRLMGAVLYWAEGTKGGLCEITNSDPHLILFMVKWMESIFTIPPLNLKARLNIYPQQSEKNIKSFWSELTGIPLVNFGKSFVKPVSKGYKKNNLYYGTIKVTIPKSVNIKHKIFGWVSGVLRNIAPNVQLVQQRWESLSKTQRPLPVNLRQR